MSAETSVLGAAALGRLGVLGETDEELIQGRRALISSSYFHIAIRQLLFPLNERRHGLWVTGLQRQGAACACFLDENENDDPLCCLVHPVPVQHYFQQHLHASPALCCSSIGHCRAYFTVWGLEVVILHSVKNDEQLMVLCTVISLFSYARKERRVPCTAEITVPVLRNDKNKQTKTYLIISVMIRHKKQ